MKTVNSREAAIACLSLFPPAIRISTLETKGFRDQLGLSVDAVVQLHAIGTEFQRSALFKCIRALLSGTTPSSELTDKNNRIWTISLDSEKHGITMTASENSCLLPDFTCLHPNVEDRVAWFDAEVAKCGVGR
jgi:hypothetical protein